MPLLPSCILEPLVQTWLELLPDRPAYDPGHPLGCHRRRIAEAVAVEKMIEKAVTGLGWERLADQRISDRTLRRRMATYIEAGIAEQLLTQALAGFEKLIGLDESNLAADGCKAKAPCGGQVAGPSGVDRGKQGINKHVLIEGHGLPIGLDVDKAGRPDHCMLPATLTDANHRLTPITGGITGATIDLDRGYDYRHVHTDLATHHLHANIRPRNQPPVPLRFDNRWKSERTHSWMANYRILAHCTERTRPATTFWHTLIAAIVTIRQLIRHARTTHRWPNRPTNPRLR